MKRHLLSLFSILISGLTIGQNYAIINCNVTGIKDGSKVYLVPTLDGLRDSSVVKNSKFQFKIPVSEGNIYTIRLTRDYEPYKWKEFYVEKGVINIESQNGSFRTFSVSGSKYAEDFNSYNKWLDSHDIFDKLDTISIMQKEAARNNDSILLGKSFREYKKVDSLRTVYAKQWVQDHPASPISSYVLFSDVRLNASVEELDVALNGLLPEAKKNAPGKELQAKVDAAKATAIGQIAPDFVQNDTAGNPVSVRAFRGKTILIDFWASWCVPCREENPSLVAAFEKYKDKGFTILSVSLDDDKTKWIQAILKDKLLWTHVSDLKSWDNAVARQYDIGSVPSNFLLDQEGRIIAKNLRGEELHRKLFDIFK